MAFAVFRFRGVNFEAMGLGHIIIKVNNIAICEASVKPIRGAQNKLITTFHHLLVCVRLSIRPERGLGCQCVICIVGQMGQKALD